MAEDDIVIKATGEDNGAAAVLGNTQDGMDRLASAVEKLTTAMAASSTPTQQVGHDIKDLGEETQKTRTHFENLTHHGDKLYESFEEIGKHGRTLSIAFEALGLEGGAAMAKITAGAEAMNLIVSKTGGYLFGMTAALAGVAGAVIFLADAAKTAAKFEYEMSLLGNVVRNQGGDWGKLKKEVQEYIEVQSKTTTFGDDEVAASLKRLVAAHIDLHDAMLINSAAENAAAATGKSLADVENALMQTAHGRARALTTLGIGTRETIKEGMTLQQVLDAINKNMGNSATAATNTYAGAQKSLENAFDRLKIKIGNDMIPTLRELTTDLVHFVDYVNDNAPSIANKFELIYHEIRAVATAAHDQSDQMDMLFDSMQQAGHAVNEAFLDAIRSVGRLDLGMGILLNKIGSFIEKIPGIGAAFAKATDEAGFGLGRLGNKLMGIQSGDALQYSDATMKDIYNQTGQKGGLNPNILRTLAVLESNEGKSLVDGRGDKDSSGHYHGVGPFQKDDQTTTPGRVYPPGTVPVDPILLEKIRTDPEVAARQAVKDFLGFEGSAHGNLRTAAAMYNGGQGGYKGSKPQAYADHFMEVFENLEFGREPNHVGGSEHGSSGSDRLDNNAEVGGQSSKQKARAEEVARHKEFEQMYQEKKTAIEAEAAAAQTDSTAKHAAAQREIADLQALKTLKGPLGGTMSKTESNRLDKEIADISKRDISQQEAAERKKTEIANKAISERLAAAKEEAAHKVNIGEISIQQEIDQLKKLDLAKDLSAAQHRQLQKEIDSLSKSSALQAEKLAQQQEEAIKKSIALIEKDIEVELVLSGNRTKAKADLEKFIAMTLEYNTAVGNAAAASGIRKLSPLLSADAEEDIIAKEYSVKAAEYAIDASTKIKSERLRRKAVVIEAAIAELEVEAAAAKAIGQAGEAAYKRIEAAVERLKDKQLMYSDEASTAAQAEADKASAAYEKMATAMADHLEKMFDAGKKGFKSFAEAFKDMLKEMETAFLKSAFLKALFGIGPDYGTIGQNSVLGGIFGGAAGGGGTTGINGASATAAAVSGAQSHGILGAFLGAGGATQVISALPTDYSGSGSMMTVLGGSGSAQSLMSLPGSSGLDAGNAAAGGSGGTGGLSSMLGGGAFKAHGFSMGNLMLGLAVGQLVGTAMGGGSHTTWGEIGGAVGSFFGPAGAAIGGAVGGLFGHADDPNKMPDKYDTQNYGQFVSNINGSIGSYDGHNIDAQQQYSKAAGHVSLATQMENFINSPNATYGLNTTQQQILTQLKALEVNGTGLNIKSEKDGVFTLQSGKTISVKDYESLVSQYQQFGGASNSSPLFNITHPFPDFMNAQISQVGSYTPVSSTGGNNGLTQQPPVQVIVQGSVIAQNELSKVISDALADYLKRNPNIGSRRGS